MRIRLTATFLLLAFVGCQTNVPIQTAPVHVELDNLLKKINERLALMESVAVYKRAHGKAIDDPEREAAMLAELEKKAVARQLSPQEIRSFFSQQIQAAKIVQLNWFAKWDQDGNKIASESNDLSAARQRINAINDELLQSLKEFHQKRDSIDNDAIAKRAKELLQADGIDDRGAETAIKSLLKKQ